MKTRLRRGRDYAGWLGVLLATGLGVAGCGQAGSGAGGRSFDSARPEIKAVWDKAMAADQANDYVTAVKGYRQIMSQPQLTPGQDKAVKEAASKLSLRMWKAAHNGDPSARQALAEQQKLNGLRPLAK